MSDFYIGYLPKAPTSLASFIRKVILGLGLLAVAVASVLVLSQMPFANSFFEFGKLRDFDGTIIAGPYPTLLVARPGDIGPADKYSEYLLVAPGKHAADDLVAAFDGQPVHLQGQLIYRDGRTMIEVVPASIHATPGAVAAAQQAARDLGPATVIGEIVDSKCYLGVMNPGRGKVHRDCAARCLSGGIPPIFISADGRQQFLLVGPEGRALRPDSLREFIAEPITIHGERLQRGDTQLLEIDPEKLRHTPDGVQKALKLSASLR